GVYALAIDKDIIHYTSKVQDKPIDSYYPDGKKGPKEWYGYYKGTITVDYAIRKSANTIPVRLLQDIGIDASYEFLTQKLKCKHLTEVDKNMSSLALGGCAYGMTTTESAAAYAIFGNKGVFHEPTTYHKIERLDGEVVIEYDTTGEQVIAPSSATIMNHLLQGVVYGSEGTGSGIRGFNYSLKAFAKTGTSSESNDLWMVAGSPYYVGSVWYGFDMPQEIKSTSAAATIWRDVMKTVHKGLAKKTFEDSEDVYKKGSGYYKKGTSPDSTTTINGSESSSEVPSSSVPDATVSQPPTTSTPSDSTSSGTTATEPSEGTESTPPKEDGDSAGGESGNESGSSSTPAGGGTGTEPENPKPPENPPQPPTTGGGTNPAEQ
ncbi:MAG: penicillin-binding transpeptidase domain-containing protein, partial [Acutalibacteraceae bacterium]|nr:penicillin-binding transpeptidase domain-containing protein [Acutalibacteraceae bacterium]